MILDKSKVAREILIELIKRVNDEGYVILHTRDVYRNIITYGAGSCSVDRYLRYMRKLGIIEYDNPKRNNHFYKIKIEDPMYFVEKDANKTIDKIWRFQSITDRYLEKAKETDKIWKLWR